MCASITLSSYIFFVTNISYIRDSFYSSIKRSQPNSSKSQCRAMVQLNISFDVPYTLFFIIIQTRFSSIKRVESFRRLSIIQDDQFCRIHFKHYFYFIAKVFLSVFILSNITRYISILALFYKFVLKINKINNIFRYNFSRNCYHVPSYFFKYIYKINHCKINH